MSYIGQTRRNLKQRYKEHVRYVRNSDPQYANAQHILRNHHEYDSTNDTMTLLKRIDRPSMLIAYKQLFIQAYHQHGHLITEQYTDEQNSLYELAIDSAYTSPRTVWTDQYSPNSNINQFHPSQASSS